MPIISHPVAPQGPLIEAVVGISDARVVELQRSLAPIPAQAQVMALVDPGSKKTFVDGRLLRQLGLEPNGDEEIFTPSTGEAGHVCKKFEVSLGIVHPIGPTRFGRVFVLESEFSSQGFHVLLGRDFLQNCLFVYHGKSNAFDLAY